jgi:hypothetical protein
MCCLRVFEIHVKPYSTTMSDFGILLFLIRSLRLSLTSPATLEHLKFSIVFEGIDNYYDHDIFITTLRNADFWTHLDSIITHPTGSRLQKVDINIEYAFRHDDDGREPDSSEVTEPVLDALPLLREKGILFVEDQSHTSLPNHILIMAPSTIKSRSQQSLSMQDDLKG